MERLRNFRRMRLLLKQNLPLKSAAPPPGLVDSCRAVSLVPSNIAEGCGRDGDAELARFCIIARGSATELEYQLLLARDLTLLHPDDYEQLSQQTIQIKRMVTVLVQKLTAES